MPNFNTVNKKDSENIQGRRELFPQGKRYKFSHIEINNKTKMYKIFSVQLFVIATLFLLGYIDRAEAQSKRCTWFGAKTLRACKLSCKALGHDTGVCDDNDRCICSEVEYNFLEDVTQWFEETLDPSTLISRMDTKFTEYKEKFKSWKISEKLRPLVPSKCKIGASFCDNACKAIGRYNGVCNADNTDCDCSDDWVTPKQYGLCASETICRLDCQANKKATGKCVKSGGWDCECESNKVSDNANRDGIDDTEGTGEREPVTLEYDNSEDVELFDARRKKRSMWTRY